MTDLFTPDGHLTDQGLKALIDGTLTEMERLEAGEHLSFCDKCIDRYTALLTGEVLMEPQTDQVLPTMRRVQKRRMSDTVRRYASAAAAVAIGSVLWYTGIFDSVAKTLTESPSQILRPQAQTEQAAELPEPENSWGAAIMKAVDTWSMQVREKAAPAFTGRIPQKEASADTSAAKTESTKENHV